MAKSWISSPSSSVTDEDVISRVSDLPVLSFDGSPTPFGQLIAPKDGISNAVVIFIRHFFCSCDQDYVRSIVQAFKPKVILSTPSIEPTRLIIIGCGEPTRILPYVAETSCMFPVFTDPTGLVYEELGMKRSWHLPPQPPPYMKHSLSRLVMTSVRQIFGSRYDAFRGGDFWQNGGEWIFRKGRCVWGHRMDTTGDHATAEEFLRVLSSEETDGLGQSKAFDAVTTDAG